MAKKKKKKKGGGRRLDLLKSDLYLLPLVILVTSRSRDLRMIKSLDSRLGGGWNFLRSKGGKIFCVIFFCIRPPLQVFLNGP